MSDASARILAELEEITNRMSTGGIPCLHDFILLTNRRDELVRQWMENPAGDADSLRRLGAVVRGGVEAESRLRAIRQAILSDIDGTEKLRCLARELGGMVSPPRHMVNLEA